MDSDFIGLEGGTVSVKCGRDAAEAAERGARCPGAVTTSHYVGRYGWNTVDWTGPVPDDEVRELFDASCDAALAALPQPTAGGSRRVTAKGCAQGEVPRAECALRPIARRRPRRSDPPGGIRLRTR